MLYSQENAYGLMKNCVEIIFTLKKISVFKKNVTRIARDNSQLFAQCFGLDSCQQ